jgi:phosphonate transport system ATP-binding protein
LFGKDPWQLSALHLQKMRSSIGLIHQSPPIPLRQRVITAILAGRLGQWPFWKSLASLIYPIDIQGPAELLEKLGLTGRLFDRCDQLSGGQLQRVSVARTLYQGAQLILADEPVSAMDPVLADLTIQILKEDALQRQATFIASLHAVDIALRWFPRIIGLRDGAVFFDLRAEDVTQNLLRELYASEAGSIPTQNNQQILGL